MAHIRAGFAEYDCRRGFVKAQHVEDRIFAVAHGGSQHAVFDIDMLAGLTLRLDTHGIALELLGQHRDFLRHGGREHQSAAAFGGGGKDEFEVFAEA